MDYTATKQIDSTGAILEGSNKLTICPPGYTGFVPEADINDKAMQQSTKVQRNSSKKELLAESFNVKLPGYTGYRPTDFTNDRGQVRPNLFSTVGEEFH